MNSTDFNWGDNTIDSRDIINYYEERLDEKETYESIVEEAEEALEEADEEYLSSRMAYERDDSERERYEYLEKVYEDSLKDLEDATKDLEDAFDHDEFKLLEDIISQGEGSPDWSYGETLIHESYFTQYIEELINDCYEMPKEFLNGNWPWNHMEMDWESAAEEAKSDYMTIEADGETYYIRA